MVQHRIYRHISLDFGLEYDDCFCFAVCFLRRFFRIYFPISPLDLVEHQLPLQCLQSSQKQIIVYTLVFYIKKSPIFVFEV